MGMPTGASSGRIQMPSWLLPIPSSRCEQHMPQLVMPRSLDFLILKSPGSTAPGRVTTTFSPAFMLGAPQMMPRGTLLPSSSVSFHSSPQSTWHQLMVLPFFCGSGVASTT